MKTLRLLIPLLLILKVCTGALQAYSPEPTAVPPTPTLLLTKDPMTGAVVLSWNVTATPYSVARNTDPDFFGPETPIIVASGLGTATFSDATLNDGVDYFYTIEDGNTTTKVYGVSVTGASAGESIILTGVGFASTLGDNSVFVAGEPATVTGVTNTTLTFTMPTQTVSGSVVVSTPTGGASSGTPLLTVLTAGLPGITSLAVDDAHVPFLATAGSGTDADRVFTFDPGTGVRTQVGALGEATGLGVDNNDGVFYGNATINAANQGSIERTTSAGGKGFYRACGQATIDPCYVFATGVDPLLTDFGAGGRLYVADGADGTVKLVPPGGLIQVFASGLSFGAPPRGVLPNRNSGSSLFHDVFIADSTAVRQFDSSTVPGTLVKTYDASNSPVRSPRQMVLTPPPRERLLIADDVQDRIVMINPQTDAAKLLEIPVTDPRGIAVDVDAMTGAAFAYVAEPSRVVRVPVSKTVFVKVWVANGVGVGPQRVMNQIRRANRSLEKCGIEVKLRDEELTFFNAGTLFDLDVNDFGTGPGQVNCNTVGLTRTIEETMLLENLRSAEPTDLNVYFVNSFTLSGGGAPGFIAETVTGDCFPDVAGMDETRSGIILSVDKLNQYLSETTNTVAHEIIHALMYRIAWGTSQDEHLQPNGSALPADNIMSVPASRGRWATNGDQCLNINVDDTIFRGDP